MTEGGILKRSFLVVLVTGLLALFIPVFIILSGVLNYTNGRFIYPFDDTLIHLKIAQNLAADGVWGINNDQFAAASSSLLYTVILTASRLFSDSIFVPFIINAIAAVVLLLSLQIWLLKQHLSVWAQVGIVLLTIFFTPLPTLVISGMEHTIQCLVCFLFIFYFSGWLDQSLIHKQGLPWWLAALAVLVGSVRYEGLLLIGIAVGLLFYYRNFKTAFSLGVLSLLPVLIFGLYSVSKGNYFLPNSVLVKSDNLNTAGLTGFMGNILFEKLTYARNGLGALATQRWVLILPLTYFAFKPVLQRVHLTILIFLVTAVILHLSLAATGTLYRYEAYLFFSCIVFTGFLFFSHAKNVWASHSFISRMAIVLLLFFLFFPVCLRGLSGIHKTGQACINIYDQQYQMSQFSRKYFNGTTIAANDIGALSYFTNSPIIDLWGLATIEVTKSRRGGYWTPQFLDSFCRANHVKLAIVYDSWFNNALESRWKKIATWQIQNNVICGDDTVSFYSVDMTSQTFIKKSLEDYQRALPPSVRVRYY
jgi:hypothetical protein